VLATIAVDEGARVRTGELIASLDDRVARLAAAKAALARDQAQAKAGNELRIQYADKALEVARAEMQRSRESNEKFARSISQSQLDVERLTVEKLELERRQAEHDVTLEKFDLQLAENALQAAQLDLELHAVRAPFDGVVALVRGRAGEWVEPGAPVARLVAIDRLRAEGFAPAELADAGAIGAKAWFTLEAGSERGSPEPVEGVLRFVSPEVDPVTRQVRIWAEIDNQTRRLRPGQQGRIELELPAAAAAP
jgi:macrolide-specific efflux system membrane fusion protein